MDILHERMLTQFAAALLIIPVAAEAELPEGRQVLRALPASGAAPSLLQAQDGGMFTWSDGTLSAAPDSGFPVPCPCMAHTPVEATGVWRRFR